MRNRVLTGEFLRSLWTEYIRIPKKGDIIRVVNRTKEGETNFTVRVVNIKDSGDYYYITWTQPPKYDPTIGEWGSFRWYPKGLQRYGIQSLKIIK